MNWFKGTHPSRAEMRSELDAYLRVSHATKKHVARTKELLEDLWKQARSRPFVDVWPHLDALDDVSPKGTIKGAAIKSAFRHRILSRQDNRCCYCRRWLVNTAYAKPIEHVLPRGHYPQFSIEFWNMAVSCNDCNSAKTDKVWGSISKTSRRYPRAEEFTDSFHPRFHRYDDHVRFLRMETNSQTVTLFTGLTPQGRHLCRSLLHQVAAKETLIENNPVVAEAMKEIRTFEAKAGSVILTRFDAFRAALDQSLERLIK
ncbi:hypothetical protein [Rhizobium sp. 1399]|uniref:HNH endonuclease n=1 Tax=Rhizobium sp. 1399 TaxID=2817758 RepID=UPI0028665C1C|nr:hypothetical protein [Rhizobium sp. 1399]MDR6667085.1 uncharacterized protein (TIGR02646 family) [Rhizobium sp. 1399]